MGVPKRKTSRSRRDKRRTHKKLRSPNVALCPQCQEPKLSHRVCPSCGFYNGKQILEVEEG